MLIQRLGNFTANKKAWKLVEKKRTTPFPKGCDLIFIR
jgi:hypothetical protein